MTAAVYDLMDYDDVLEKYDPVMGMEVHVELATETKMFSASSAHFGAEPNSNVDPVSLGLPGALPVVNAKGVEWAIKIGLALNCSIAESSRFARKNYFYPDQPKNYQISQYDEPIAYDGYLDVCSTTARNGAWKLNAPTWRKTPANSPTSAVPTDASTAQQVRLWTATAPVCPS